MVEVVNALEKNENSPTVATLAIVFIPCLEW